MYPHPPGAKHRQLFRPTGALFFSFAALSSAKAFLTPLTVIGEQALQLRQTQHYGRINVISSMVPGQEGQDPLRHDHRSPCVSPPPPPSLALRSSSTSLFRSLAHRDWELIHMGGVGGTDSGGDQVCPQRHTVPNAADVTGALPCRLYQQPAEHTTGFVMFCFPHAPIL